MNAKEEFLIHIKDRVVKCAIIKGGDCDWKPEFPFNLLVGHSKADYEVFISSLDFQYDSRLGGQNLFGIIWYEDGTWSKKGEYYGSEWWIYQQRPQIPGELMPILGL